MYLAIVSKLVGESLLSFYSIFVKKINVELILQIWSRFFMYVAISAFFVDWVFIYKSILSTYGLLLSLTTILHVYFSYRSFQLLDSGVATTLYYIYPIIILLLYGIPLTPILLIPLFGVYLIANDSKKELYKNNPDSRKDSIIKNDTTVKEHFWNEGIIAAFIAALTEAFIFYFVKNIKTLNNWNHIFLSYFIGASVLTPYLWKNIINMQLYSGLSLSLAVNAFIGLFGYYLRFYAISRLDTYIYAILTYFGIVMSYVYGVVLNNDKITMQKIIGTLCIVLTNLYMLKERRIDL
uniref:EamA domain-containing protein n=1 Tax=viral metagenome TaxID=1070528 RepID=A0A6C0E334_9ZZZZ